MNMQFKDLKVGDKFYTTTDKDRVVLFEKTNDKWCTAKCLTKGHEKYEHNKNYLFNNKENVINYEDSTI